jgi:Tfp pilus assembly PilM family ATPase
MNALSRWLASAPADAAVEITPEAVSMAAIVDRGSDLVVQGYAIAELPAGAVTPSLTGHNIADKDAVSQALRSAAEQLGSKPRRIALLIPDVTSRVSFVSFEKVPARREDLDSLVRWQIRKSAPFPVDDAVVSAVPGAKNAQGGQEFVVVLARREMIREYEAVCDAAGMHAGLIDLATFGLIDLVLGTEAPAGDWLLVHMQPGYASLAVMRGSDLIFFRNVTAPDLEALGDTAHQTAMHYQDRLDGKGFAQALVGGSGLGAADVDQARRVLESRLGVATKPVDPTRRVSLTDRITASPELLGILAPLAGALLRMRAETTAA